MARISQSVRSIFLHFILLVALFSILCSSARAQSSSDLILVNGKIITVDVKDSVAQALAIHDGKIVAVGTNEEIRSRAPKKLA